MLNGWCDHDSRSCRPQTGRWKRFGISHLDARFQTGRDYMHGVYARMCRSSHTVRRRFQGDPISTAFEICPETWPILQKRRGKIDAFADPVPFGPWFWQLTSNFRVFHNPLTTSDLP